MLPCLASQFLQPEFPTACYVLLWVCSAPCNALLLQFPPRSPCHWPWPLSSASSVIWCSTFQLTFGSQLLLLFPDVYFTQTTSSFPYILNSSFAFVSLLWFHNLLWSVVTRATYTFKWGAILLSRHHSFSTSVYLLLKAKSSLVLVPAAHGAVNPSLQWLPEPLTGVNLKPPLVAAPIWYFLTGFCAPFMLTQRDHLIGSAAYKLKCIHEFSQRKSSTAPLDSLAFHIFLKEFIVIYMHTEFSYCHL